MNVSTKQRRIAELARMNPKMVFTSLNHHLDEEWLRHAYDLTRKDGAVGTDGRTLRWEFGKGNYKKGPTSPWNQIKKWGERGFK